VEREGRELEDDEDGIFALSPVDGVDLVAQSVKIPPVLAGRQCDVRGDQAGFRVPLDGPG